jgi:hypothetical protein
VSIFGCRAGFGDDSLAMRLSKRTGGFVGGGTADLKGSLDGTPARFINSKTIRYPNLAGYKVIDDFSTPGYMRWFKNGTEIKSPEFNNYLPPERNFGMSRAWTNKLPHWLKGK